MQIQVHTDNLIEGGEALAKWVQSELQPRLSRFKEHTNAARATLAAHATNVAMPYLQNWIRERDDARNGGPGAAGSLR